MAHIIPDEPRPERQRDLEERVAALEAAVALFARALLCKGGITINDARAAMGLPAIPELAEPGGVPGAA